MAPATLSAMALPQSPSAPPLDQVALGNPSFVWRFGQDRRLALVDRCATLSGARVLDLGCGIGTYVRHIAEVAALAAGVDIDRARVARGAASGVSNLSLAVAESLPFRDGAFDVVLLNEVIEHVRDDRATLREALRVVRPGGQVVVFAPNRGYPFETHGVYLGKRYVFGNIPLVNWLPDPVRNRLVPHARVYTSAGIRRLARGLPARLVVHSYVYPGFDNVHARWPRLARMLRAACYRAEHTPLRCMGLSHFLVLRRTEAR